ncbi:MAG: sugar-binding domain-containing protein [Limisphaerales bacterium]
MKSVSTFMAVLALVFMGVCRSLAAERERAFNTNWLFLRGEASGAEQPRFDDSAWRHVDLPHDWSIEDLPPRESDPLYATIALAPGVWRFSAGDQSAWVAPGFDDSPWREVTLPQSWDRHRHTGDAADVGCYRRHFTVPAAAIGKTVLIELGVINGHDWIYVDGVKVEETGDGYWANDSVMDRAMELPPAQSTPGDHVVAVRIKGPATGGFIAVVSPPEGPSPLDPGRSAGNISTGYAVGGIGWYRRHFTMPSSDQGKQVRVVFDGAYMETTVWINGVEVGRNQYGYSPFGFDLTPYLKPAGEENVLAVKILNQGMNSRWYSGSGLYRPVHLEVTGPLRVAPWGLSIRTPAVTPDEARVNVQVELLDSGPAVDATVLLRVLDAHGKAVASCQTNCSVSTAGAVTALSVAIAKPSLWSPVSPALYRAQVSVLRQNETVDLTETSFGIRSLAWNAEHGFQLNGQTIKLRGGCFHHDHGPLGAAAFPLAEERRVKILKAAGFNAIRCSHNMPAASFLDACDREGVLVVDEAFDMWNESKNSRDYSRFFKDDWQRDVDAMLQRDRNHPCVVMWSIGNEIPERFDASGAVTAKLLADHIRSLDSSRPITAAFNDPSEKGDLFFSALDVCGYNYSPKAFERDHARLPQRVMMTTESFPKDAFEYWAAVQRLPCVIGDFVWTAWDYRGESAIGHTVPEGETSSYLLGWPYANAFCGDFDVCGFIKPQSLYRQVLWDIRPLAILAEDLPPSRHTKPEYWGWRDEQPSWTWPGWEGQPRVVRVYAKGDEARLLLNGREIASQPIDAEFTAIFTVPYEPGKLKAEALKNGKIIATEQIHTADAPVAIHLTIENPTIAADDQSIAFIDVEAVDAGGRLAPLADNRVRVAVGGGGILAAFGNGDPRNVGSVQQPAQNLWRGRALLIVRSNGSHKRITIEASADKLAPARAAITVR